MNISEIHVGFFLYWFIFCGIIMTGYFATASGCYYLLYSDQKNKPQDSSFQNHRKRLETIIADIKLSTLSMILFALGAASFMTCYDHGLTQVYTHWKIKDLGYILVSYGLVLLLQDTYFYFTHRLFHLPWLFW
ncbi:MAG: sterol desaturase family protein, partial [Cyanobacteria bacterium P01_D01_bin.56]